MKKIKPTLIQFESGHLNRHDLNAVVNHLSESGYLVYYGGYQGDALAMQRDFLSSSRQSAQEMCRLAASGIKGVREIWEV